jgi:TrmH family RNA methyltransferase
MLSANKLKFLTALKLKKFREKEGLFVVEGEKMVAEALAQTVVEVVEIFALPEWISKNTAALRGRKCEPNTEAELKKISNLQTPNQVFATCRIPNFVIDSQRVTNDFSLFLDEIRDPGNVGAILRIADWFGIGQVFVAPGNVEIFSPKVVQASMGAIFRVRVFEKKLDELTASFPNLPVLGATLDGDDIFRTDLPRKGLLVIGNESRGIGAENLKFLTQKIGIPPAPTGGAESLNAAVAAGILCAVLVNKA